MTCKHDLEHGLVPTRRLCCPTAEFHTAQQLRTVSGCGLARPRDGQPGGGYYITRSQVRNKQSRSKMSPKILCYGRIVWIDQRGLSP